MDSCTHFIFLLAAVLLIIVCIVFLLGTWYAWKHVKTIQGNVNIIINNFEDISKSLAEIAKELSQFAPGAAEKISEITGRLQSSLKDFDFGQQEQMTNLYKDM